MKDVRELTNTIKDELSKRHIQMSQEDYITLSKQIQKRYAFYCLTRLINQVVSDLHLSIASYFINRDPETKKDLEMIANTYNCILNECKTILEKTKSKNIEHELVVAESFHSFDEQIKNLQKQVQTEDGKTILGDMVKRQKTLIQESIYDFAKDYLSTLNTDSHAVLDNKDALQKVLQEISLITYGTNMILKNAFAKSNDTFFKRMVSPYNNGVSKNDIGL